MNKYYYAQLNNENICIGVSELSGEINSSNLIKIERFDTSLLGKKYENGEFIEVPKTEEELKEEELQKLKQKYITLIKEADLLGDVEEKQRLQQEYLQKKAEIENRA
ncbi:hypothetical protein SAMN02745883_00683 [Caminicella sporogenes DSM 14501]|uniref:Uncharacterized protein n=1 Tax=Caminicella sporogenes DSM 14501 TaxID=1121266 RepID=A0A1M6MWZ1_9FIRM|nr:hypothetical protein [Caminicella sporogenes]RKD22462.1 hypothetical protein BET04_05365 [Caminicella sporogenes]SHJ87995.1 hypothetical protein SAMN02745883_00683 [Caminicella sporogenes DSM 14501]